MDFAEILNQWEESQKSLSKKYKSQNKNNSSKEISSFQKSKKKANADFIEKGFPNPQDAKKVLSELKKKKAQEKINYEKQMKIEAARKINPMEMWLRRYGTVDKDKVIEQYEQNKKMQSHEYIKNIPIDAYLDLHGMTRDEAWSRLDVFVQDCVRRGLKKIMFIHGKGNHSASSDPVLGELVRLFIEKNKMLGTSGHPNRNQGGSGATWVLIKSNLN